MSIRFKSPRLPRGAWVVSALWFATAASAGQPHPSFDYAQQATWAGVLDHAQSPVDVVTGSAVPADGKDSGALLISTGRATTQVEDNGHAVQVDAEHVDAMIRGRHFRLAQFHFHASSEHTFDGKSFPLEAHFVFKAQDGRLAVVAVMYQAGAANPAIEPVLADLKASRHRATQVDIAALMPANLSYYHYLGSLTTPPLTENVEWYVLESPMTLSRDEIQALQAVHPRNNRQRQPMNGRPLVHFQE